MLENNGLTLLRKKAEERLSELSSKLDSEPIESVEKLLHEISVYQIELEMQNEELRSSYESLSEAKDMFMQLYENAPIAYIIVNSNGQIGLANNKFYEILKLGKTVNVKRRSLTDFIFAEDKNMFYSVFKSFYRAPETHRFDLRFDTGTEVIYAVVTGVRYPKALAVYKDLSGYDLLVTIHDVTEKRLLERELNEKNEFLNKLNDNLKTQVDYEINQRLRHEQLLFEQKKFADMGEMLSSIAHQWRQPLNVLSLIFQSLKVSKEKQSEDELEELTNTGFEIIEYLSETITDFKDFFKPSKDKAYFNVAESTFAAVRIIKKQMEEAGVKLRFSCVCCDKNIEAERLENVPDCFSEGSIVYGFANEFKQVLLNLLYNAKDATIAKHGRTGASVIISIVNNDENVEISVEDNGGGISNAITDKVFDPYFTTKKELNGTGIGLYMCKMIVEMHFGGKITFSNSDEGAIFTVSLPKK